MNSFVNWSEEFEIGVLIEVAKLGKRIIEVLVGDLNIHDIICFDISISDGETEEFII